MAPNENNIAAVLLAAGESVRMGENKALLPWLRGLSLVSYQVHALNVAGFTPIIVVVGYEVERVRIAVPSLANVMVVENERYGEGRVSSTLRGLAEVPLGSSGVLFLNVDSPRTASVLLKLREAFEMSRPPLAVLAHQGRPGHPPLFGATVLSELRGITEDGQGIWEIQQRHLGERLLVETGSPMAMVNINTPEEYQVALRTARALSEA